MPYEMSTAAKIRVYANHGYTYAQIAEALDVSFSEIRRALSAKPEYDNERKIEKMAKGKRGGKVVALTTEEKAKIVEMYKQGTAVTAIAQTMGRHKSCIYKVISGWIEQGDSIFDEAEKEPATAATVTSSEQNNLNNNSADIVPLSEEDVKTPTIPDAVEEACLDKIDYLRKEIAAEQAVIDDWKAQIAEIEEFLKSANYKEEA